MKLKLSEDKKIEIEKFAEIFRQDILNKKQLSDLKNPLEKVSSIDPNIILIRFPGLGNESGFSCNIDKYSCIYINSSMTLGRQYCTFWHEIYHCINDERNENIQCIENYDDIEEEEANEFSYNMILPREELSEKIIRLSKSFKNITIEELISIQYEMRVSMQVLLKRITDIYSDSTLENKYIKYTSTKFEKEFNSKIKECGYPLDLVRSTNDVCLPKSFYLNVLDNIKNGKISISKGEKIMSMLGTKEATWKW